MGLGSIFVGGIILEQIWYIGQYEGYLLFQYFYMYSIMFQRFDIIFEFLFHLLTFMYHCFSRMKSVSFCEILCFMFLCSHNCIQRFFCNDMFFYYVVTVCYIFLYMFWQIFYFKSQDFEYFYMNDCRGFGLYCVEHILQS